MRAPRSGQCPCFGCPSRDVMSSGPCGGRSVGFYHTMGPPSPQFDADCVLKGINDHVQAMQERIGELESELARSIALNVELAANLAASLDIESTASEKRGRAEEELAALQRRYDELRRSTSTSSREIERLTGQMNQANEANTALQCLRSSQETRMAEYETRLALTLQENERLMNEIEELKKRLMAQVSFRGQR